MEMIPSRTVNGKSDLDFITSRWIGEIVHVHRGNELYQSNAFGEWNRIRTTIRPIRQPINNLIRVKKKKKKTTIFFIKDNLVPLSEDCCICLSNHEETALLLPCEHRNFHFTCVSEWLEKHKTCPICRASVEGI